MKSVKSICILCLPAMCFRGAPLAAEENAELKEETLKSTAQEPAEEDVDEEGEGAQKAGAEDEAASPEKEDEAAPPEKEDEAAPPEKEDEAAPPEKEDEAASPEKEDEAASPEKEVILDTVTVVGVNEFEELRKSGYPITVIDVDDFAGRPVTVSDLLDRVPGVRVRRTGGVGSDTTISVRGLEGKRVQVYVQGMPLNSPDGTFVLDDIPLHVIERIEVYKGVVPAKFGGDGLGGAVNIVTKEFSPKYADVSYTVESYNVHKLSASGRTYLDKPGIALGISFQGQYAENDYPMPWSDSESGTFRRDHDRYRQLMGEISIGFNKLYFDKLELALEYAAETKQIQGITDCVATDNEAPDSNIQHARTWGHTVGAVLQAAKDDFIVDKLDLVYSLVIPFMYSGLVDKSYTAYNFDGQSYASPLGRGEVGRGPNDSKDKRLEVRQRFNLDYQLFAPFSLNLNNQLQYTYNAPEDKLADEALGFRATPLPGNMLAMTTGLSGELKLFDDRWLTVAGFKHHFFTNEGHDTSLYPYGDDADYISDEAERHSRHGFGGNVASRFSIVDWFMIKASYEHGQRMPTADEVFGNGFDIKANPDLKPEKSDNVIAGFLLEKKFGEGNNAVSLNLESDFFIMFLEDMIRLGGTTIKNYANIDKAEIKGVDGTFGLGLTRYLYLYFSGTFQDIRNKTKYVAGSTQVNFLNGKRIPNSPPYFFRWGAELTFYDVFVRVAAPTTFSLFYDGGHVAKFLYAYKVSNNPQEGVPACTTHDVGFRLTLRGGRYSLSASVSNIADAQRYDKFHVPLPGRVFKLMVRGTFH